MAGTADDVAWRLFVDWCAAVDASPLPASVATISDFFDQVPASEPTLRARLRAIRKAHRATGNTLRVAPEPTPTAWRSGPGWLPLGEALAQVPVGGWPAALRGRRDAFLLTVIHHAHLTRNAAVRLSVDDIGWPHTPSPLRPITVHGHRIEPGDDPLSCPACAVTRWLRIAALANQWGRASVRQALILEPTQPDAHDCAEPPPPSWRDVWQLAPAIDQHGWMTDWRPMSTRAVSTVLAEHLTDRRRPRPEPAAATETIEQDPWDTDSAPPSEPRTGPVDECELWALLEEKVAAADAANARITALLDDTDALLGSLSDPVLTAEEAAER